VLKGEVLQELFWCDPCPVLEHPLEVKRAQVDVFGYFVERRLPSEILLIECDRFRNSFIVDLLLG
jgi:hypothetical protein